MLKLNENKTLKELSDKGFYINGYDFYYEVNSLVHIVFDANMYDEEYLSYIGDKYSSLIEPHQYDNEIEKVLNNLKKEEFVIDVED